MTGAVAERDDDPAISAGDEVRKAVPIDVDRQQGRVGIVVAAELGARYLQRTVAPPGVEERTRVRKLGIEIGDVGFTVAIPVRNAERAEAYRADDGFAGREAASGKRAQDLNSPVVRGAFWSAMGLATKSPITTSARPSLLRSPTARSMGATGVA
jgi:hypothetical protein